MGHIELPVPVYHITFMNQLLQLLRARCVYCGRLKLDRAEINLAKCKLQLLQYGLLQEVQDLDKIHLTTKLSKNLGMSGTTSSTDEESESEGEDKGSLMQRRDTFVKYAVRKIVNQEYKAEVQGRKLEVVAEEKRAVVKNFLAMAPNVRTCGSCKGYDN